MRKTNIFRNLRPENKVSFLIGWRRLKRHRQIFAILALTLWLVSPILMMVDGDFINVQLINLFSGPMLFYSYVTVFSVSPNSRRSIINQLSVQDDRLCIAGEVLPANVKKLALGKDPDRGIAFIQLAWNSGDEWQFAIEEYQAVANYLSQNLPQLNVVHE
jgi:hypothetical protein